MLGVLDPEGAHLAALRRLADFSRARVLEVGCGDGRLTLGIAEQAESVFAFDPDEAAALVEAPRSQGISHGAVARDHRRWFVYRPP